MSTSRDTKWGACCAAIAAEMRKPSGTAQAWPSLSVNIGPDEAASTAAAPLLTMMHDSGEGVSPALRGGAGGSVRHPFDRIVSIKFEVWGRDPVESEAMYECLLLALDAVAHGRASKPGNAQPEIGSMTAGNLGTKYAGTFQLRIAVAAPPVRRAPVETTDPPTTLTVAAADDSTSEGVTFP